MNHQATPIFLSVFDHPTFTNRGSQPRREHKTNLQMDGSDAGLLGLRQVQLQESLRGGRRSRGRFFRGEFIRGELMMVVIFGEIKGGLMVI